MVLYHLCYPWVTNNVEAIGLANGIGTAVGTPKIELITLLDNLIQSLLAIIGRIVNLS